MKSQMACALLVAFVLAMAGCAPEDSLFGLVGDNDKEFDQRLVGDWSMQSGSEFKPGEQSARIVFRQSGNDPEYEVTLFDFDEHGMNIVCTGQLVRLGTALFIDFGTRSPEKHKFAEIPFPALETHIFGRIRIEQNSVRIDFLSDDWVKAQVQAGKMTLATVGTKDGPVISAPTEELRKFALEHAQDSGAFSESYSMIRNQQPPA
ncbi:MAG TPA: hypothetical protein VEI73_10655 [Candidatus Acidoferrum sp.]|nr:hypothetical protein [Candidatus Acidoferrum sp.]